MRRQEGLYGEEHIKSFFMTSCNYLLMFFFRGAPFSISIFFELGMFSLCSRF